MRIREMRGQGKVRNALMNQAFFPDSILASRGFEKGSPTICAYGCTKKKRSEGSSYTGEKGTGRNKIESSKAELTDNRWNPRA